MKKQLAVLVAVSLQMASCVTRAEVDRQFDTGSRMDTTSVTPIQVDNLFTLGKVWGFLKYHHPRAVDGALHWDYELFRVLPRIVGAADAASANEALHHWIRGLGSVPACSWCAEEPVNRPVMPRLGWLSKRALLGNELTSDLQLIYARRGAVAEQFYVAIRSGGAGNADFSREAGYPGDAVPDAGYRLLALYRFWNIVEYWFPYRDVMQEDWDAVLREFIPRLVGALTRDDYELALMALIARVHDGHANLWTAARPPRGDCHLPVRVRLIEGQPVVDAYLDRYLGPATGLEIGDVIQTLGGQSVDALVQSWRPYYGVSHESAYQHQAAATLPRGACGPTPLEVKRLGRSIERTVERVPSNSLELAASSGHHHPGAFRRLSDELAYLELSGARVHDSSRYVERAAGAQCLVLDIRNYPEFVVFSLGQHLVSRETPFALITEPDPSNPGSFIWTDPIALTPAAPLFKGRLAILVDEVSMSRAEYVAMAFRSVPGAIVVGSTTAGADGNYSALSLPGGLRTGISGLGVYYPDRRPTQRVGIVPDIVARPTLAGIRSGEDEVLEVAVKAVLGRTLTAAERAALRPPDPGAPTKH